MVNICSGTTGGFYGVMCAYSLDAYKQRQVSVLLSAVYRYVPYNALNFTFYNYYKMKGLYMFPKHEWSVYMLAGGLTGISVATITYPFSAGTHSVRGLFSIYPVMFLAVATQFSMIEIFRSL